jgi:hypothetical protein
MNPITAESSGAHINPAHWRLTEDPAARLAAFRTGPAVRAAVVLGPVGP